MGRPTDIDQFRMEEELARIVGDRETVENENKMLRRRVSSLESQLVRSLITISSTRGAD